MSEERTQYDAGAPDYRLTPAMVEHLRGLSREAQFVQVRIEEFIAYCRAELGVPADWAFTGRVEGVAFAPPAGGSHLLPDKSGSLALSPPTESEHS